MDPYEVRSAYSSKVFMLGMQYSILLQEAFISQDLIILIIISQDLINID